MPSDRPCRLCRRRATLLAVSAGEIGVSVSVTLQVVALALPSLIIVVIGLFLWAAARRRQTQVVGPPAPQAALTDPTGLDSLLQSMSGRVAAVEGRLGAVAAELQGVALLQQRLAAVEASMPSLQEAYEKYGDQVARADKRTTERERRNKADDAKFQTAGDAAAVLSGAGGAGGETPALTQPPVPQNGGRAGVVGSGGRARFGKAE